jgi:O-antigen/teichoic acid export membrane protein
MSSPAPAPTASGDDDSLKVSSSANIEGIVLTTLIILVAFMCGGMLFWGGLVSCHDDHLNKTLPFMTLTPLLVFFSLFFRTFFQTYWRKGQKNTVDLETLEGLIDNEGK